MYTRPIAGLAVQLAARLAAGGTAGAVRVVDYTRVPQAVFIALMV